jgi:hypothetical protein
MLGGSRVVGAASTTTVIFEYDSIRPAADLRFTIRQGDMKDRATGMVV